jgi:hypothetical protein
MKNSPRFPDREHASADELEHRMNVTEKLEAPARMSVSILDDMMSQIMKRLGINPDGDVKAQMEFLGIEIRSISSEDPGCKNCGGIYVSKLNFVAAQPAPEPYAFIREPDADSQGRWYYTPGYWDGFDFVGSERKKI